MGRGRFKRGSGGGGPSGGRGRGGRGRGRGGGGGGGSGGGSRHYQDNRQSFDQVHKHHDKFERFYNTLNIVPTGPERDAFWATLRRELPNSFRFTGSKGHALSVRDNLVQRFFPILKEIKHDGRPVELPNPMPWYPEGLAYSMATPKNVVRKYEPFKEFQKFLVSETGVGNISRQEQVSMIPPLLLDVRPEHTVLDLCAAPGSKSAQLIELIHAGEEESVHGAISQAKREKMEGNGMVDVNGDISEQSPADSGRTTGLLVANDVNYQRAQMLVHQVKRLNSPNLIVTNHDATMFPSIELSSLAPAGGEPKKGRYLKFDRILADVPCSGDGTCRKNPNIWKEWNPQNGLGLYITQVRILTRALQMLKVGGRVVYSTCSMNPVEDEAVVSSAIERCGGVAKVQLVDCSEQLPGLIRCKGLTDWSIMNRNGKLYESWPEAEQYEPADSKVVPGMFAPDPEERIPLDRCMRVYPHQQDTGGFFIAVLEKKTEIKAKPEHKSKCSSRTWKVDGSEASGQPQTEFSELVHEVETMPKDAEGYLRNPNGVAASNGDVSAAERQNASEPEESEARLKRKAEHDLDGGAKKARLGDAPSGSRSSSDTMRREHWPLPPSVTMAVTASDAQPGADIVEDIDNDANGEVQGVNEGAEDAATNAQFADADVPGSVLQAPPRRRRRGDNEQPSEEAFKYLSPTHPELESIYTFYELHPSFPRDRFLVRNPTGDPVKGIYYSSHLVKEILQVNEGRGMKFVHAGVKMFMKQDAQGQAGVCRWRIQTEGLPIIEGWVGDGRVVRLWKKKTLRKLLVEMFPRVGKKEDPDAGWRQLGEIGEQVLEMGMGCCVLRVEAGKQCNEEESEDGLKEGLTLPLWRSLYSVNLMLPKEERKAMLLRIFQEEIELVNHSDPRAKKDIKDEDEEKDIKGSIKAEKDAEEVKVKMEQASGGPASGDASVNGGDGGPVGSDLYPDPVFESEVVEEVLAEADGVEGGTLEEVEDEDAKLAAAMPARDGEGDDYNTTV